jgi:hypothetical protein
MSGVYRRRQQHTSALCERRSETSSLGPSPPPLQRRDVSRRRGGETGDPCTVGAVRQIPGSACARESKLPVAKLQRRLRDAEQIPRRPQYGQKPRQVAPAAIAELARLARAGCRRWDRVRLADVVKEMDP